MEDSLTRAKQALARRDFGAAEMLFRKAAEEGFELEAMYGLGVVNYQLSRFDEAIDHLSAAADADPENPNIYYYLGMVAVATKERDDAVSLFAQALAHDPGHAGAGREMVLVLQQRNANMLPPRPATPQPSVTAAPFPTQTVAAISPPSPVEAPPPPSGRWSESTIGRARHIRQSVENRMTVQVLRFRVEDADKTGPQSESLQVGIRGYAIYGAVEEGDWMEVPPPPAILPSWRWQVLNLSTGELVYGKKGQIG